MCVLLTFRIPRGFHEAFVPEDCDISSDVRLLYFYEIVYGEKNFYIIY